MRLVIFLVIFSKIAFSCAGDCASCHTNLDYKNDKRHSSMQECKNCHTDEKMAKIDMGGCGQDCFACHNAQKLMTPELLKSHKIIKECIECHTKLTPFNQNLFPKSPKIDFQNPFEKFKNPDN